MMVMVSARAAAIIRTTVTAVAVTVVLAEAVHAQPAQKLPVIGILASGQLRTGPPYPALERALRELGLVDGQNVRIEFRMAEGRIERLPGLAVELVRSFGRSNSQPSGWNCSKKSPRRGGRSRCCRINSPSTLKTAESTARIFGLRLQSIEFRTPPYDYAAAFASVASARSGAALVTVGPVFFRDRARLVEIAGQQRIPTMFPLPEFADAGGLIAYGANLDATFSSAALNMKPSDLPIEQPKFFELVVNMKAAKAMGVTIPPSVLLRADRVIE